MASPAVPFIDQGNQLLAAVPARLDTGTVTNPDGGRAAVITIRTASTTLTVILAPDDYIIWLQILRDLERTLTAGPDATPDQAGAPAEPDQ